MTRLALLCLLAAMGCAQTRPSEVPAANQSPAVVVMGATPDGAGNVAWRPLCGGVAVSSTLVVTALDCVSDPGLLGLAVVDADRWQHTTDAQIAAAVHVTDPERGSALLRVGGVLEASVSPVAVAAHDGELASFSPEPGRAEKTVVMAARDDRGLISASSSGGCLSLSRGSAVLNTSGELVGIVTTVNATASEYRVPRFQIAGR